MTERDAISIGQIPAGATILRRASPEDWLGGATRVIFYETKDGSQHWLHIDGHTETTLRVVGAGGEREDRK